MSDEQRLWKLTPKGPKDDIAWRATTDIDVPIIVRAHDATTARELASVAFAKATGPQASRCTIARDPWQDAALTNAEEYLGTDYKRAGQSKVLLPEQD